MDTMEIPTFSSEEERNEFIAGDREKRIWLDAVETETALQKLEDLSQLMNEKTERLTNFYQQLEERLRQFDIGYPFILKNEEDEIQDNRYRLCYFEDAAGDLFFWRLGYSKLSSNWYIVAHLYKVECADKTPVEGTRCKHIWLKDNTVKLTHSSRDLRIAAAHIIRDFVQKFLSQVSYNEHLVDNAVKRVEKLQDIV